MNRETIAELDRQDPLAHLRDKFELPADTLYFDGNSLGALPKAAQLAARKSVEEEWGTDLIASWNKHRWIDLPQSIGDKIAPLLGAARGQVIVADSISVNLFKLLSYALDLNAPRSTILSQRDNFPTDLYIAQGLEHLLGQQRCTLTCVESPELEAALSEDVAVLMLTHVNFRTGSIHDMSRLTRRAHDKGVLVIWDLAHSAGALPLELDTCEVDFALGCGYKYLNGGPGAPAFMYVAKRHHQRASQPLTGWMGHADPFAFTEEYAQGRGMNQFLCGTPPVVSMRALDAALDTFDGIDMEEVRKKSIRLTELFLQFKAEHAELESLRLVSPINPEIRGSQLAFSHPEGHAICKALIARKVIPDFRAPDIIRFGFTPLYMRYADVARCVDTLAMIVREGIYTAPEYQTFEKVT
ncbi:MAG: kynureninase [Pseudomonadota bacterium]